MDRSPSCIEALLTDDARSTKAVLHCVVDRKIRGRAVAAAIALEVSATPIMLSASPAFRVAKGHTSTWNINIRPPPQNFNLHVSPPRGPASDLLCLSAQSAC